MNICKRILLLFLLCVVLFAQYSPLHTVYATELDDDIGISTTELTPEDISGGNVKLVQLLNYNTSWLSTINFNDKITKTVSVPDDYSFFFNDFQLSLVDGGIVVEEGNSFTFELTGIRHRLNITDTLYEVSSSYDAIPSPYRMALYFVDVDNSWLNQIELDTTKLKVSDDGSLTFNVEAIAPVDTYKVIVRIYYKINDYYKDVPNIDYVASRYNTNIIYGFDSDSGYNFVVHDKTVSLLSSIIEFLKSIVSGIIELPSKIASSLKGFFDSIVNSVVELGNTILEGIKGLFVPSEEDITEMKDKWEQLLSDRFGALYQVVDLISDYVEVFQASEQGTITFPSVTIPLGEADFVFGGWEVQIVPSGFDVLFTALKSIISIVCTVWCVNGLKNRFEKLVGGADNI